MSYPGQRARYWCKVEAVITKPGTPHPNATEPYAKLGRVLEDNHPERDPERHDGRTMPMGWNVGKVIPVGTEGTAEYIQMGNASLWKFTSTADAEPPQTAA